MSEPRTSRRGTWWVVAGLLVTFVALAMRVGLPIYRRKQAIDAIARIGGNIEFTAVPKYPGVPQCWLRALAVVSYAGAQPDSWPLGSTTLQCEFFDFAQRDAESRQRALELVRRLPAFEELKWLNLSTAYLDDNDLAFVAGLRRLEGLNLSNTPLNAAGLKHLVRLSRLEHLYLSGTDVDDDGLRYLADSRELRTLWLDRTRVSNDGMQFLARLPKLQYLSVSNTAVTDLGLEELRRTHPDLEVTDD